MKKLYSVFDSKAQSYGPIFGVPNDVVATREFVAVVVAKDSVINKYPDDFELHCVGEFLDPDEVVPEIAKTPVVGFVPAMVISARQVLDAQPVTGGE